MTLTLPHLSWSWPTFSFADDERDKLLSVVGPAQPLETRHTIRDEAEGITGICSRPRRMRCKVCKLLSNRLVMFTRIFAA